MNFYTYIITSINEDNKGERVENIARHARKNNIRELVVDLHHGGGVHIYVDHMMLNTEWRGARLDRQYYTLEAALHDGIEFARGYCPEEEEAA